jgi:hypothetical protein
VDERAPIDPAKLLAFWMEWEKGETPPGQVMANLKTGGLKELLEELTTALRTVE